MPCEILKIVGISEMYYKTAFQKQTNRQTTVDLIVKSATSCCMGKAFTVSENWRKFWVD